MWYSAESCVYFLMSPFHFNYAFPVLPGSVVSFKNPHSATTMVSLFCQVLWFPDVPIPLQLRSPCSARFCGFLMSPFQYNYALLVLPGSFFFQPGPVYRTGQNVTSQCWKCMIWGHFAGIYNRQVLFMFLEQGTMWIYTLSYNMLNDMLVIFPHWYTMLCWCVWMWIIVLKW